ncbi:hypothetical protein ACFFX1_24695 [Dactylosporangium sucinum]|uniref:Uncharacterized protein n=1 Tax=Dactylosporangium sucinum TaxID=1424081 RepID=A0A917T5H6_9ACTN|nr:hypothetical protein [Dactylosporangium sucinum]GGM09801.1 hypothetical protein GCM10007977_008700 [Dactylosporangium sucinum]
MTTYLQPVERHLIGSAADLSAMLRSEYARGHLVRWSTPARRDDDRYSISITVLEPPSRRAVRRRWLRLALWTLAGLMTTALGALLVHWVITHLWIAAAVSAVVLAAIAATARSNGDHCRGCGHR